MRIKCVAMGSLHIDWPLGSKCLVSGVDVSGVDVATSISIMGNGDLDMHRSVSEPYKSRVEVWGVNVQGMDAF